MNHDFNKIIISQAALTRLPQYYRYLKGKSEKGIQAISSTMIASELDFSSIQVRKDLALISNIAGKPKTGFHVKELLKSIEKFLGYDNVNRAILVGAGKLGKALLSYNGFKDYGLDIIMGFDKNRNLYHKKVNNKDIFPLEKIEELLKQTKIQIGIITVPADAAQDICDVMVKSGVEAIWNFAPVHLNVPEDIVVKNEDVASSLAILSNELKKRLKD